MKKITKKTTTSPRVKEMASVVKASMKVMGKTYYATGNSTKEALENLNIRNCKGRGILKVESGDYVKERFLMPMIVSRLCNSHGLAKEVAIKNISLLFAI